MQKNWKKNIVLFLASQTISLFGSSLVQYAIIWHITLQTQSGVMMTIGILCGFVPTLLLSPFAGVWADRYNRKVLIAISDSLIAAGALVLGILFMQGHTALWLLFAMSAFRALGSGVQNPAVASALPQMVPTQHLTRVNAIGGTIQAVVALLSPMASGALLALASIEIIFFIDVFTALIAVVILIFLIKIPAREGEGRGEARSYFLDMRKGIAYIKAHGYLRRFFIYCAIFMFLMAPAAFLTPLQVTRSFGEDVWRLTAIEIAFSVGMILGGITMTAWGGFRNRMYTILMAFVGIALSTLSLGLAGAFWLYLLFMGLAGVTMPMFNTPATVLLQEKVDPDYMGRIFGIMTMITSSVMPLGMLVFGPLADRVPIEWMLVGTGVLLLLGGCFLLLDRELFRAGLPSEA